MDAVIQDQRTFRRGLLLPVAKRRFSRFCHKNAPRVPIACANYMVRGVFPPVIL